MLPSDFTTKDIERFWSKVNIPDDPDACWEWQAGRNKDGYGRFKLRDKNKTSHRIAYLVKRGDIPDGLRVLHHCDNPPCCNPNHLFLGTQQDNVNDMLRKGRDNKAKGESNGGAKLKEAEIEEIKRLFQQGVSKRALSKAFDVSRTQIARIVNNLSWKYLT